MAPLFQVRAFVPPELRAAVEDFGRLLERGYPRRALLKVVGDRYRLSAELRTVLARGVSTRREAQLRRRKLTRRLRGRIVRVDCLNVLFTIQSYLQGKLLFVGVDGFLRDTAEDHGKSHGGTLVDRCVSLIMSYAALDPPAELVFYVDAPVSHSGQTAQTIRRELDRAGLRGSALVTASPDRMLKEAADCVIATSDSAVIDAAAVRVADLARLILESSFSPDFLRLDRGGPRFPGRGSAASVYSLE